ncbi:hypothetical protein FQR65_LT00345 [Abscondita terminalis]|nr:hypothetical protein FQR65_LT00345 [Abscondita terminalis]
MFGFTCIAGIFFRSFGKSTAHAIYDKNKVKILPVTLCLVASTLSGVSLLGFPSEVYMHGTQISVMVVSIVLMGVINNYIYLPVFYDLNIKNPLDYLELRFGYSVKKTASVFCMISGVLSLPLIIYVPSLALTQVQLKTTEWLSSLQLTIIIVALGVVLIMGTISVGGISNILKKSNEGHRLELFNMDLNPTTRCTFWTVLIGNIFSWLGFVAVNPLGVQRFTSFQCINDAKKVLVLFVFLAALTKLVSCFSGLIIYTRYIDCDPLSIGYMQLANEILPFYVLEVTSKCPGLSGLFVAGLFSTALTTLSTSLSSISSELFNDLVAPIVSDEVAKKIHNQITSMFIVGIAMMSTASIVVIERLGSVLELFQCAYGVTGGPVLGMFTLGMLFPRANKKGALYGGFVSAIIMALTITQHLLEIWTGKIVYENKHLNTTGCNLETFIYGGNETQLRLTNMTLAFLSWIDYTVFSILTAVGCVVGVYFGFYKKQDSVQNYLNGQNLKWFPVSMSLVSSALAGFTLLGYPTEIYMYGTQISLVVVSILLCGWINYFVFLPVFFKLQLSSIYEYLEMRYNIYIKNAFSLVFIVSTLFNLPIVMYVPSLIFSQVSGVNLHVIAPIMILICIFYTVAGGIKAVIWADTLQFAVTALTLTFVIALSVNSIGGFDVVFHRIKAGDRLEFFNFSLNPTVRSTFWTALIGHTFTWISLRAVSAPEVQRFVALSSMNNVKKTLIIFTVVIATAKSLCFLLGMVIYAKYHDCDPKSMGEIEKMDQIVPYFVTEVAQGIVGLNGLFVAAYFGSAFSSFSTALNTVSSVLYTDFVHSCISNEYCQNKEAIILKTITFAIGVSSIGMIYLIENVGTIFEIVHYAKGVTGGATLGIFTLGLVVPFANAKGAVAGGVTSMILMGIIIVKTQIYIWNGAIKQTPKPLYTYGCTLSNSSRNFAESLSTTTLATVIESEDEPIFLFRISLQYYCMIGTMTTIFIGVLVSWFTRKKTDEEVNLDYISPFIHKICCKFRQTSKYHKEAEPLTAQQHGDKILT